MTVWDQIIDSTILITAIALLCLAFGPDVKQAWLDDSPLDCHPHMPDDPYGLRG